MKKMIAVTILMAAFGVQTHAQSVSQFTIEQKTDAIIQQLQTESASESYPDDIKDKIRAKLMEQTALANLARKEGLNKLPAVQILTEVSAEQVLAGQYITSKKASFHPTDAQLRAEYDKQVDKGQEYHLRHILVNSEAQATKLIAQMQAGGSFQSLAKKYSKDPGSATKGGDLGWMPLDSWVPEFKDAAAVLQPKQISSTPVKTQFGYHIIQLVEPSRTPKNIPKFEAVREQLIEMVTKEYIKQLSQ